jgi:hypothetical protein
MEQFFVLNHNPDITNGVIENVLRHLFRGNRKNYVL